MGYLEMTKREIVIEEQLLTKYRRTLEHLPKGRLIYKRIRGRLHYYVSEEGTGRQTYIKDQDRTLIYNLKYRRLLELAVKRIEQNLKYQKKMIDKYQPYQLSEVQKTLSGVYSDQLLREYLDAALEQSRCSQNPFYREDLTDCTSFGLYVRTKSEALIAELLHAAEITFQYESELRLRDEEGRGVTYYPDFQILTPIGKTIYWEHVGRMDLENYRNGFFRKLTNYHYNNIIVLDNLILTMNGPGGQLDVAAIDRVIRGQLLPYFQ